MIIGIQLVGHRIRGVLIDLIRIRFLFSRGQGWLGTGVGGGISDVY